MRAIQRTWEIVEEFRKAYIVLNLVYYGLVAGGMVYVAFNPCLQQTLLGAVGSTFGKGRNSRHGGQNSLSI